MASPSVETMRDELWMFVRCQEPDPSGDCDPQEYLRKKKDVNDIREMLLSISGTSLESDIISMLYEKKKEDIKKNKEVYEKVQKEKKWKRHCGSCGRDPIHHPELFNDDIVYDLGRWGCADGCAGSSLRFDRNAAEKKLFELFDGHPKLPNGEKILRHGRDKYVRADDLVFDPQLSPILYQALSDYYEKVTKDVDVSPPSIPDETEIKKMASEYHEMKSKSSEPDPETLCTSEEEMSDEEEDFEEILVDGVEYCVNKDDNTVVRVDDFSPVGKWDKVNERIVWDPVCDD